ncbi:MAG: dihydropteroate synthase-like protein [Candidatus Altiarchaeota archaeon]
MKILVVTGENSRRLVEKTISEFDEIEVFQSKTKVSSLITPGSLLAELKTKDISHQDLIIVPGQAKGDFSIVKEKLGIHCVKGPKHLIDLPFTLNKIDSTTFSSHKPADEVLKAEIRKKNKKILGQSQRPADWIKKIGQSDKPTLNGITQIIAEIVDAPLLTKTEIQRQAKHFTQSGASIIDIGMVAGVDNSDKVKKLISAIKNVVKVPVSVDTLNPHELEAAIKSKADLLISLSEQTLQLAEGLKIPAVVIPQDKKGDIPNTALGKMKLLEKITLQMDQFGYQKYIVDPIMNPPLSNMTTSLEAYISYRRRHPNTTMLVGAGNVYELMDADSPGINAILASIASELSIELLLATEASPKARGCVKELKTAVQMAYLAKQKGQPPKDLGIDLLRLKEKKEKENPIADELVKVPRKKAQLSEPNLENQYFKIYLADGQIHAAHFKKGKPTTIITGTDATHIYREAIRTDLIEKRQHAAYLGMELAKAEIALKLGKNYIQDEELF